MAPEEAIEPAFAALNDEVRSVRTMGFVVLLWL